jgi:hypothetical protein
MKFLCFALTAAQAGAQFMEEGVSAAEARAAVPAMRPEAGVPAMPSALADKFKSLSSNALEMQCQQLEYARERGQNRWMEEQGIYGHLSKMCEALKRSQRNPEEAARFAEREQVMVQDGMGQDKAGKSLALGCTALLKAKDDGKMEWFESQSWYKKAMKMCTSLSGTSPEELEQRVQDTKQDFAGSFTSLQSKTPSDMLKGTCSKLAETPADHPVRGKAWFANAERMCATVQTSSSDELRELIHRQQSRAETASGQLVKQACAKLENDGDMKHDMSNMELVKAMSRMCAKLGPKKVGFNGLQKRCAWLQKIKSSGKESNFKTQSWYPRLESACQWMRNGKQPQRMVSPQEEIHILV